MHRRRFLHAAAGTVIGSSIAGCLGRLGFGGGGSSDGFESATRWAVGPRSTADYYSSLLIQSDPTKRTELWRSVVDSEADIRYPLTIDFPWGTVESTAIDRVLQFQISAPRFPNYWLFEYPFDQDHVRSWLADEADGDTYSGFDCYTWNPRPESFPPITHCVGDDVVLQVGDGSVEVGQEAVRRILDLGRGDVESGVATRNDIQVVADRLSPSMHTALQAMHSGDTGDNQSDSEEQRLVRGWTARPNGKFVAVRRVQLIGTPESPSPADLREIATEHHASNASEEISVDVDDRIATVQYQRPAERWLRSHYPALPTRT